MKDSDTRRSKRSGLTGAALRIVVIYALFSGFWILLSDTAVAWLFADPAQITLVSTIKGWLFVAVTSLLLYALIRRYAGQIVAASRREVAALKQARSEAVPVAEPFAASETSNGRAEATKETLAYNDVEILRALAAEPYVYGNLAGLTEKTGLARETVSSRLALLKSLGIIETRINDKNILHWCVSPRGKQLLGEILSGQEERT